MLVPGTVLQDRYQIVEHIGQGGMGSVYKAVHTSITATYAIKMMQADTSQPHLSDAFKSEANLLAHLRHPTLPRVTDYFTENGRLFLVMDFVAGDDFATLLDERGAPFPVHEVLGWADTLLDALEYLHSQSPPIIHRDIKPQNLKLDPDGNLYLLDFGLAKGAEGTLLTGFTAYYAPLEQFQGLGSDARGDLYSLAVTLHHLLTNISPQGVTTRASAVIGNQPDPQPAVHMLNPQVPEAVSLVLTKAMAIRAEDRYASAAEMRAALQAALNGESQQPAIPSAPSSTPLTEPTTVVPKPPSQPIPTIHTERLDQHNQPQTSDQPAPPQQPASPPAKKSSPMPLIVGVVVVLLLLGGGGGAFVMFISNDPDNGAVASQSSDSDGAITDTDESDETDEDEDEEPDDSGGTISVPPLDNQIVFVSDRDGSQDIFVMDADGSNPQNLTSSPDDDETAPAISPDGTRIAFESDGDIFVMNADGSDQTNLTKGEGENEAPTWSPDGEQIAFVSDDTLSVMNADGSERTTVTDETGSYDDPDWSPDGEQIVFAFEADIYVINVDDPDMTNLTNSSDERDVEPAWSPDGEQIVFASDRDGDSFDIYVMNAAGRSVSRVTDNDPLDDAPAWSPDGEQIVFRSGRDRGNPEIYVMNIDGTEQTNLTEEPDAEDINPDWSP